MTQLVKYITYGHRHGISIKKISNLLMSPSLNYMLLGNIQIHCYCSVHTCISGDPMLSMPPPKPPPCDSKQPIFRAHSCHMHGSVSDRKIQLVPSRSLERTIQGVVSSPIWTQTWSSGDSWMNSRHMVNSGCCIVKHTLRRIRGNAVTQANCVPKVRYKFRLSRGKTAWSCIRIDMGCNVANEQS